MDDDWASDGDESNDLGDFAIPEISVPAPPSPPQQAPRPADPTPAPPVINAWTSASNSGDARLATRLRNAANRPNPPSKPPPPGMRTIVNNRDPRSNRMGNNTSTAPKSAPPGIPVAKNAVGARGPGTSTGAIDAAMDGGARPGIGERGAMPRGPGPGPGPGVPSVGGGGVSGGGPGPASPANLYAWNFAPEVGETQIAAHFARCGVAVHDVKLVRGEGGGKAAVVTVRGDANVNMALGMDGGKLEGRSVFVKMDGAGRSKGYGFGAGRERGEGWGRGGGAKNKGKGEQRDDPSIPVGPAPAGRKKLMLKPRTKPMPVLEVDQRAIDGVKGTGGVAVGNAGPKEAERVGKGGGAVGSGRRGGRDGAGGGRWVGGREERDGGEKWSSLGRGKEMGRGRGGMVRGGAGRGAGSRRDDENKNRPVLLNNFAALEVNDSDV